MRKLSSFNELLDLIAEENLDILKNVFGDVFADSREEQICLILGRQFDSDILIGEYMVQGKRMVYIKTPKDRVCVVPAK